MGFLPTLVFLIPGPKFPLILGVPHPQFPNTFELSFDALSLMIYVFLFPVCPEVCQDTVRRSGSSKNLSVVLGVSSGR